MEIYGYSQITDETKKVIKSMAERAINNAGKAHKLLEKGEYIQSAEFSSEAMFWASRAIVNFFGKDSDSLIDLAKIMDSLVESGKVKPFFHDAVISAIGISASEFEGIDAGLFKECSEELCDNTYKLLEELRDIMK